MQLLVFKKHLKKHDCLQTHNAPQCKISSKSFILKLNNIGTNIETILIPSPGADWLSQSISARL